MKKQIDYEKIKDLEIMLFDCSYDLYSITLDTNATEKETAAIDKAYAYCNNASKILADLYKGRAQKC